MISYIIPMIYYMIPMISYTFLMISYIIPMISYIRCRADPPKSWEYELGILGIVINNIR